MNRDDSIEKNPQKLILSLRDTLIKEGFTITWEDPFFCWVHNEPFPAQEEPEKMPLKFYVAEPPIPKISPFDLAVVEIGGDILPNIDFILHFNLCLYYSSVVEEKVRYGDIDALYEEHDQKWLIANMEYFGNISSRYDLEWDIEYDDCICDTLWHSFSTKDYYKVVQIMKEIKQEKLRYEAASKKASNPHSIFEI